MDTFNLIILIVAAAVNAVVWPLGIYLSKTASKEQ